MTGYSEYCNRVSMANRQVHGNFGSFAGAKNSGRRTLSTFAPGSSPPSLNVAAHDVQVRAVDRESLPALSQRLGANPSRGVPILFNYSKRSDAAERRNGQFAATSRFREIHGSS